jgi:hypothetical protein
MGYDKRAAAEALTGAAAKLKDDVGGAERETQLLKGAIAYLAGVRES